MKSPRFSPHEKNCAYIAKNFVTHGKQQHKLQKISDIIFDLNKKTVKKRTNSLCYGLKV